jgi:hypothetical protein
MAQANFNIRGWQGRWRYTASTALFFVWQELGPAQSRGALSRAIPTPRSGDLAEATATAALFHLLEFPEHPHKGGAQTDDDTQEQQGQSRGCEHGEHP